MTRLKLSDLPMEVKKQILGQDKPNKYRARKTTIDGIKFDSKKEADYYCELKIRKRAGEIKEFELQPVFILQEEFVKNGVRIREIKYFADFKVIYSDGRVEIIDIKPSGAFKTKEYRLKRKLFEKMYPELIITEVY